MRKSLGLIFASFIVICGLSAISFAQNGDRHRGNINQRQQNQRERIKQGVKSGELTGKEAARLAKEQREIQRIEARLREDGLTPRERLKLERELNDASRGIYRQKHDEQDRP